MTRKPGVGHRHIRYEQQRQRKYMETGSTNGGTAGTGDTGGRTDTRANYTQPDSLAKGEGEETGHRETAAVQRTLQVWCRFACLIVRCPHIEPGPHCRGSILSSPHPSLPHPRPWAERGRGGGGAGLLCLPTKSSLSPEHSCVDQARRCRR